MMTTDRPSIFKNTYTHCNWAPLPHDNFGEYMVIPMICDPAHAWYVKIPTFAARTALYITARINELIAHTLGAFGQLTEHSHAYVQRELLGLSYASVHTLHARVIDAAEGSIQANEAFVFHAIEHLHHKMCADYDRLQAIFSRNITISEKATALTSTVVEWTFLLVEVALTQMSSTAAFLAESALDVEALIRPDMQSDAYKKARANFAKHGVHSNRKPSGGSSSGSTSYNNPATPLNQLPTFTTEGIKNAAKISYSSLQSDPQAYHAWIVSAYSFLGANQDNIHPVKLRWHANLCYYDTFMQTMLHTMLMNGTLCNQKTIEGLFAYDSSHFGGERAELSALRADIIRYTLGLIQGVDKAKSIQITLDGNLPIPVHNQTLGQGVVKCLSNGRYESFGSQWDVEDVKTLFYTAAALGFDKKNRVKPEEIGKVPLAVGIHPSHEGHYTFQHRQLPINEWFATDRKMLFVEHPKCFDNLKIWLQDLALNADVILHYKDVGYSIRNISGSDAKQLLQTIADDRAAKRSSERGISFTSKHLPDIGLLDSVDGQEARHFHSHSTPLVEKQGDFASSVQHAFTNAYTNTGAAAWLIPDKDIASSVQQATSLDDLRPLFMVKDTSLTMQACVDHDEWTLVHERFALLRLRITDQKMDGRRTLRDPDQMVHPERSFELKGKRFDLTAFTRHTGALGGGHWIAYRNIGDSWYELDDYRKNSLISEAQVEAYLKGSGHQYQIREVLYKVRAIVNN